MNNIIKAQHVCFERSKDWDFKVATKRIHNEHLIRLFEYFKINGYKNLGYLNELDYEPIEVNDGKETLSMHVYRDSLDLLYFIYSSTSRGDFAISPFFIEITKNGYVKNKLFRMFTLVNYEEFSKYFIDSDDLNVCFNKGYLG